MASLFYECAGVVSASVADPSALTCSLGWLAVSEPTYTLVTQEQAGDLAIAIILLWGTAKSLGFILSLMGFKS